MSDEPLVRRPGMLGSNIRKGQPPGGMMHKSQRPPGRKPKGSKDTDEIKERANAFLEKHEIFTPGLVPEMPKAPTPAPPSAAHN